MDKTLTTELIESISPKIYRHLIKIGANREDARDIVQDALYKAVLYIDSIGSNQISAWLFKVAINGYYDLCRRQNRRIEIPVDPTALVSDDDGPETRLMKEEVHGDIFRALDQLSTTQKHLLLLKYEQNLSYDEISELLGIPVSTVATYLYRARQKFMQVYKGVNND